MSNQDKINHIILKAEETCQKSGSSLTEKRKNVLLLLLNSHRPLSAYEVAEQFTKAYQKRIPTMSVYRMLDFLISENLVHKLTSENKYLACAHISCEHEHQIPQFLICNQCDKVSEVAINQKVIQALKSSVKKADYHLTKYQLELECLCNTCFASNQSTA